MANVTDIIDYYVNLLIIQYKGQPNAEATIALMAQTMLASGIIIDVMNGFNIDADLGPTAVGAQLDIIGKYVGVDRYYTSIDLINYTALVPYAQGASPPTSPPAWGLSTYATFGNNDYNGTLLYDSITTETNALTDADFLTLILFQIIINNCNFSYGALEAAVHKYLGPAVRFENGNAVMEMVYFLTAPMTPLLTAIIFKSLLPHAMSVGAGIVENVTGLMFAFTNYQQYVSPFGSGFSTYANYATLQGQTLSYSQISGE